MTVIVTLDDLARATARLRAHPLDTGAWLEVAVILHALGHTDDAEQAFATIGEGARLGGQVALAVACARHLAELGSVRGPELIDRIIETYADAPARRKKPATSPPLSHPPSDPAVLPEPAGDPLAEARALFERHGEWLTSRPQRRGPPAPLLSALSPPAARALAGVMTARAFTAGTPIIDVGEPAAALYWIAHGTVSVTRASAPEGHHLPRVPHSADPRPAQPDSGSVRSAPEAVPVPGPASGHHLPRVPHSADPRPAQPDSGSVRSAPGRPGDWTVLGELHSGAFFGEIALVGGTRRTARVTAVDDVWVLEIPARAIEAAAARHPRLAEVLAFHARARLLANLTRTSELFQALGDDDREALLARLTTELVPAGTRFIEEGAANQHLWVVVAGRCEVRAAGDAIAELGPGAAVGEISLVSGQSAVADVVAVEPAVLLRLSKQDFDAVASKHPTLLAEVERLVVARETANRALFHDASDLIL